MHRILVVNPNTTKSMTNIIDETARNIAFKEIKIKTVNPKMGPPSIEGFYDEALSLPGMLDELQRHRDWDGFIIACFDDTGLEAARSLVAGPVVGIGEAAFHVACLIGGKFTVITTLSRSIAAIESNILKYGLERRCSGIRACEVPVLDLKEKREEVYSKISTEILKAIDDDRADAVVLGCAGMTDWANTLTCEHGIPVVDGVASAVGLISSLTKMGLKTSKLNSYAVPRSKTYLGVLSPFSPNMHD